MSTDTLQTFLFDNTDIRGAIVSLDSSWHELLQGQAYSDGQIQLLGQFLAANLLLTSHIKFAGLLSLQARGDHGVSMIMSECTHDLAYRGIVRGDADIVPADFASLFSSGSFAITIEPEQGNRYQGIVELGQPSLADSLANYFARSEQLPSWFFLAANEQRACGLMLQALPANRCQDAEQREEDWQRMIHLASTLGADEMTSVDSETLLHRLFHQEPLRLFEPRPVRFHCHCSHERMERALLSLGREQLMELADEQEIIETECHFCHQRYQFPRAEILSLLQGGASETLH